MTAGRLILGGLGGLGGLGAGGAVAPGVAAVAAAADVVARGCAGLAPADWRFAANCTDEAAVAGLSAACALVLTGIAALALGRARA